MHKSWKVMLMLFLIMYLICSHRKKEQTQNIFKLVNKYWLCSVFQPLVCMNAAYIWEYHVSGLGKYVFRAVAVVGWVCVIYLQRGIVAYCGWLLYLEELVASTCPFRFIAALSGVKSLRGSSLLWYISAAWQKLLKNIAFSCPSTLAGPITYPTGVLGPVTQGPTPTWS